MRAPLVIGVDVGGTKILSGLVDREGNVVEEREVQSPREEAPEQDVLAAIDAAVDVLADERLVASGLVGFEALDGLR